MAHTLESFAAAAHDLLTAEPGPTGREKVRSLLERCCATTPSWPGT